MFHTRYKMSKPKLSTKALRAKIAELEELNRQYRELSKRAPHPRVSDAAVTAPRLEFEYIAAPGTGKAECSYWMVLPLRENDSRREGHDLPEGAACELYVPMEMETTWAELAPPPHEELEMRAPYRSGAHSVWDSQALKCDLPVYVRYGTRVERRR